MTENHLYNLAWGEYSNSLASAVQLLRCHGDLVDVTLAAGGRSFSAHKVVLCAASPFLLELLKNTSCNHPIIMLAGVQASDLEALLEFMYRGEVSIEQSQLPSLLQAAQCLNIQGLAPLNAEHLSKHSSVKTDDKSSTTEQVQEEELPVKRRKCSKAYLKSSPGPQWSKVYVQLDNTDDGVTDNQESTHQNWATHHMNLVSVSPGATPEQVQPPILVQNLTQTTTGPKIRGASDQPGTCPLCGAMLRQARNLRRHLLTSCKYRMVGSGHMTNFDQNRTEDLHNLHSISVQNLSRTNPNSAESLDGKHNLTPITCPELLTPTSNIVINMTSNNL